MQFVEITQVSLRQVHNVNVIIDVVSVMLTMVILALYCGHGLMSSCLAGGCIHKHIPINLIACKQVMQYGMQHNHSHFVNSCYANYTLFVGFFFALDSSTTSSQAQNRYSRYNVNFGGRKKDKKISSTL